MAAPKKVFDVSKPGKSPASQTTRPIIVGHKSPAGDPMVTAQQGDDSPGDPIKTAPVLAGKGKTIVPLTIHGGDTPADTEEKPAEPSPSAQPTTTDPAKAEEPVSTPDAGLSKEQPPKSAKPVVAAAIPGPPADTTPPETEAEKEEAKAAKEKEREEKERAKAEKLEQLIADKKYFVRIDEVKRRRNNNAALIVLVIIMLAAGAYLAVDAQLINTPFKVPYEIIK